MFHVRLGFVFNADVGDVSFGKSFFEFGRDRQSGADMTAAAAAREDEFYLFFFHRTSFYTKNRSLLAKIKNITSKKDIKLCTF